MLCSLFDATDYGYRQCGSYVDHMWIISLSPRGMQVTRGPKDTEERRSE